PHQVTHNPLHKPYFFHPTIIQINHNKHQLPQQQIFPPLVLLQKFHHHQQPIQIPNHSHYPLPAPIFTTHIHPPLNLPKPITTPPISINTYNQIPPPPPFPPYKKS
ncbi:aldehyde dehydrogenase family protein, partial [Staphylococcus epidermidis]|uniref:aldehyde dehydrogenase family protein n=1 Tax=Staphylococcus epidermidis TaxID=1282 RepID=UPI0011A60987